jgi:hypothetical protein
MPKVFSTSLPTVSAVTVRRALLFLADIGVPTLAAIVLDEPAGALLGCVCGLLFSFADTDQDLASRYRILFLCAFAIALGAAAGFMWPGFPWPVWLIFIAAIFASGAFIGFGKAPMLACRFGAMALVVVSGATELPLSAAWFALLAFATAAVVRLIDHVAAGHLPALRAGAPRAPGYNWVRFAFCYAAAAAVSLWIGIEIDPRRALWVVVTQIVVMQPDARTSYVRIVERVVGTVAGVVAAYGLTSVVRDQWSIAAIVLLLAALVPHHLQHRYWLHTALIALLILLAYDLAALNLTEMHGLFTERLEDVLLGAGLAVIGTVAAFPRDVPEQA